MKKYFIRTDKGQEGPFSLEELTAKGLTSKTMIWFDGISNWTEANFIPELKDIATPIPPPFEHNKSMNAETKENLNSNNNSENMTQSKEKNYRIPFIISIVIIAILLLSLIIRNSSSASKAADINKSLFRGIWTLDSEYDAFELNPDSLTFSYYQLNSETYLKGHWDIIELTVDGETINTLVLKNEIPTTGTPNYPEDKYYKYFFFKVDKIENGEIYVTFLSGHDNRRNEQHRFIRKTNH